MPEPTPPQPPTRPLRLTRAYSVISLAAILAVSVSMAWLHRSFAIDAIVRAQSSAHEDLTRSFANSIGSEHREFILSAGSIPAGELASHPMALRLREDLFSRMRGLNVAKAKIYDRAGLTVFSTESEQIGETSRRNPAFLSALGGSSAQEIVFRERFSSFDRVVANRDLLSSYVPVRAFPDAQPYAVFELYTDITDLLAKTRMEEYRIALSSLLMMLALYAFLLVFVRKADSAILAQEEKERADHELRTLLAAETDPLTGLPNRSGISRALAAKGLSESAVAIVADVDRLKPINDHMGHPEGDRVLRETAIRLLALAGQEGVVARVGGDEFALFAPAVPEGSVAAFAERAARLLSEPILSGAAPIDSSACVGASLGPVAPFGPLLQEAEAAMFRAKRLGRGRSAAYRSDWEAISSERFAMERELKAAVAEGRLALHYQAQIQGPDYRSCSGAEALMRWRRSSGEMVSPVDFIPILEETGLIVQAGAWALAEACLACRRWQAIRPGMTVSVNLSFLQIRSPSLLEDVRSALLLSGLPGDLLELELTESSLADDPDAARARLLEIKALGVRLSIDDFGTGYSSLSQLSRFPIDCLKIDQSFVRGSESDASRSDLVRAIASMASSMGMSTVAEGVETQAQLDLLRPLGCGKIQGFLFARPICGEDFLLWIEAESSAG